MEAEKEIQGSPEKILWFIHKGGSMNPTLDDSDILEILPCRTASLRPGDVILFLPTGYETAVVHRVVKLTPTGIISRGDNNDRDDPWLLQSEQILGRVIAARRGAALRRMRGGTAGLFFARLVRWRRSLRAKLSRLLHPLYVSLATSGLIRRMVPAWARPQLVRFMVGEEVRARFLWGRRIIGQYDTARRTWQIQPPFRLLIDPVLLASTIKHEYELPDNGSIYSKA